MLAGQLVQHLLGFLVRRDTAITQHGEDGVSLFRRARLRLPLGLFVVIPLSSATAIAFSDCGFLFRDLGLHGVHVGFVGRVQATQILWERLAQCQRFRAFRDHRGWFRSPHAVRHMTLS